MRGLPSGSLPIRYNSRENEIKMRRKKTEKKQFYIGDIFRVIGLIIAFSVLLYPTVSNYLYEKNGSKVISAYDENAVRLAKVTSVKCSRQQDSITKSFWEILSY